MTTKTLSDLLARHVEILTRQKTVRASLTKIADEREAVMQKATGPDDEDALAKLNLLANQETLANRELALTERQFQGSKVALLNEAYHLREVVLEALEERREKVLTRLDAKLAEFYPADKERAKLLDAMNYGNGDLPQASVIKPLHKAYVGLRSNQFVEREQSHEAYAKAVLGKVERALELLAAK